MAKPQQPEVTFRDFFNGETHALLGGERTEGGLLVARTALGEAVVAASDLESDGATVITLSRRADDGLVTLGHVGRFGKVWVADAYRPQHTGIAGFPVEPGVELPADVVAPDGWPAEDDFLGGGVQIVISDYFDFLRDAGSEQDGVSNPGLRAQLSPLLMDVGFSEYDLVVGEAFAPPLASQARP